MDLNVGKELAALRRMPVRDLQSRYADVFGETTNTHHKDWLVKRIIWRMQAVAEGDLIERARRRASNPANRPLTAPLRRSDWYDKLGCRTIDQAGQGRRERVIVFRTGFGNLPR
jgi:hypothetical protein